MKHALTKYMIYNIIKNYYFHIKRTSVFSLECVLCCFEIMPSITIFLTSFHYMCDHGKRSEQNKRSTTFWPSGASIHRHRLWVRVCGNSIVEFVQRRSETGHKHHEHRGNAAVVPVRLTVGRTLPPAFCADWKPISGHIWRIFSGKIRELAPAPETQRACWDLRQELGRPEIPELANKLSVVLWGFVGLFFLSENVCSVSVDNESNYVPIFSNYPQVTFHGRQKVFHSSTHLHEEAAGVPSIRTRCWSGLRRCVHRLPLQCVRADFPLFCLPPSPGAPRRRSRGRGYDSSRPCGRRTAWWPLLAPPAGRLPQVLLKWVRYSRANFGSTTRLMYLHL